MIAFKFDVRGMASVKNRLSMVSHDVQKKAVPMAINKTAAKAQAEVTRAVRDEFRIDASFVRNSMSLRRAAAGQMRAVVSLFGSPGKKGRSLNMIRFLSVYQGGAGAVKLRGARANKSQIKEVGKQLGFEIKKGGGLKQINGAFVGNKGRTVFQRMGGARLPIKPVQVIGVSQMFGTKRISERVNKKIEQELLVELDRAIKKVLGG